MAAGDLYFVLDSNVYVRDAESGTWALHDSNAPSSGGMCVARDGSIYVGGGTTNVTPTFSVLKDGSWSTTQLGRDGIVYGLGIDATNKLHVTNGSQIYTVETGNPLFTPAIPNDPLLNIPATLAGLTVNQSSGAVAICAQRNIWEVADGGESWTELTIPNALIDQFQRRFSAIAYDDEGDLWCYETFNQRFYRYADGVWSSQFQLPTTIGSNSITRNNIAGVAFDQGRPSAPLKIGSSDIADLKIGTADVTALYLGETRIWNRASIPSVIPVLTAIDDVSVAYNTAIADITPVTTGTPAPTITVTGLPTGITFSGGVISGKSTEVGVHTVTVTATNSAGSDSETFDLTVRSAQIHIADVSADNIRVIALPTGSGNIGDQTVLQTYTVSGLNNAHGMAFDGTNLHVADIADDNIRVIAPPTGDGDIGDQTVLRTYSVSGLTASRGLIFDGVNIHIVDSSTDNVKVIALPTGDGNIGDQTVLWSYTVSGVTSPGGMAFDGSHIHIVDSAADDVKVIALPSVSGAQTGSGNLGSQTVLRTYSVSGLSNPQSMTFDGANIHIGDVSTDNVKVIALPTGDGNIGSQTVLRTYSVSGLSAATGIASVAA